ncbi:hypothetical protein Tco_0938173 [Tanacetum coccineum]|uniref:Uncharacterized protein n=1 Tax=Tanacetum coccineum TaxID=301880 RepID=A0ABQ5DJ49_9ASTR
MGLLHKTLKDLKQPSVDIKLTLKLLLTILLSTIGLINKESETFARVRGGAEMLANGGFFSYLRVLLENRNESEKARNEKSENMSGLGLAVVSMIINSLRDSSSSSDMPLVVMHVRWLSLKNEVEVQRYDGGG